MSEINYTNTLYDVQGHNIFLDEELIAKDFKVLDQKERLYRVQLGNKAYDAVIKKFDLTTKEIVINISGMDFLIKIKEPLDRLIEDLGFLTPVKQSVKELKSPMPGLVVNIYVETGQHVFENDKLLSLEAMKMENILKSPGDGIIKSIFVKNGNSVEKGQVLIEFE